jgi:hypothetical protein
MHDVVAEAAFEERGTRVRAFAILTAAEVILQAALLFRPLDSPPLQQMPCAEFVAFGRGS